MGEAQSRQPVAAPAVQTLEAELDQIAALGLDEVRALWREMTQRNAPKALSCLDGTRRSRVIFGVALVVGAVMSSAFLCGELSPLALMLSADPLPRSRERALTAQTMPRASGSIRFPAHHLFVTLDPCAALAF